MRLAIITTHPIQYYAPVFKLLAKEIDVMVFYTWGEKSLHKHDPDFGRSIMWDIDLLSGYDYQWVKNTATDPGSHHFNGIITPDLLDELKHWQPDALLVYGWAYKSHLSVMRYFKNKVPIYFRGDSTLLDEKAGLKNLIKTIYLKWVYRHVDYAFYTGINNKAYFKKYGLKENQLVFAPHAVDNNRFAEPRDQDVKDLRAKFSIAENDQLLLFAGKFEEKKDPLLLLNAFLQIQQPNIHLLFAGSGQLKEELMTAATGNSNIHFMDFINQSHMPVVYQACDLFCFSSKGPGESWGLAVNEAMACGKAILVGDKAGCAADLVVDNYNGLHFKSGDQHDLLAGLKQLTRSQSIVLQYGQNSAKLIKDWNFEKIASTIKNKLL